MKVEDIVNLLKNADQKSAFAVVHHSISNRYTPMEPVDEGHGYIEETTIGEFFEEDCSNKNDKLTILHVAEVYEDVAVVK